METIEKVIIIGSGPAGLTAALYAARFGLNPIVIDGGQPGGQLMWTTYIENWPGEKRIRGSALMRNLREHAAETGTRFVSESVAEISTSSPFTLKTNKGTIYHAHTIIIATGAEPRKLNCPGEAEYWGKGVSPCAICDGALYQDRSVVVVGGGNSALENALFLSTYSNNITVIHIHPHLSATEKKLREMAEKDPHISFIFNNTVTHIIGDGEQVTSVELTNQKTGEKSSVSTSGVFISIGYIPSSLPFKNSIELTPKGHIKLTDGTATSIPGIFAAGDVADHRYRQAITAAGTGCMAAIDADSYLKKTGHPTP